MVRAEHGAARAALDNSAAVQGLLSQAAPEEREHGLVAHPGGVVTALTTGLLCPKPAHP